MLFHEIYGAYYNAVAAILRAAVRGELTETKLRNLCDDNAFAESFMTIIPALKSQRWQLLFPDLSTPLLHEPVLPPTTLQLRWLKAVSLDPRIKLFDVDFGFLDGIKPLYTPEDIVVPDRYSDGDDYADPRYIAVFREVLFAVKNGTKLRVLYRTDKASRETVVSPYRLEFSEAEDKFRVWVNGGKIGNVLSVARIQRAQALSDPADIPQKMPNENKAVLVLSVRKERKAVERALLHFAHYEKETEQLPDGSCRITLFYSPADRAELAVNVISFGPMISVESPQDFAELIRKRLAAQRRLPL